MNKLLEFRIIKVVGGPGSINLYHTNNNKSVSFAVNINDESVYIYDLSVAPQYQRMGLANRVLAFCKVVAKRWKLHYVTLAVEKGSWMYQWYMRKGFRVYNKKDRLYDYMLLNLNKLR